MYWAPSALPLKGHLRHQMINLALQGGLEPGRMAPWGSRMLVLVCPTWMPAYRNPCQTAPQTTATGTRTNPTHCVLTEIVGQNVSWLSLEESWYCYKSHQSDECGTWPFFLVVQVQGRCPDTPGSSKDTSSHIRIPLKRGASGARW